VGNLVVFGISAIDESSVWWCFALDYFLVIVVLGLKALCAKSTFKRQKKSVPTVIVPTI
jgi:hypothetical protein